MHRTCSAGTFSDNTVLKSFELSVDRNRAIPASDVRCSNMTHSLPSKRLEMWRNMGVYLPVFDSSCIFE